MKQIKRGLKERIKFLQNEVKRHSDLYYNQSQPEIEDREYDKFLEMAEKI